MISTIFFTSLAHASIWQGHRLIPVDGISRKSGKSVALANTSANALHRKVREESDVFLGLQLFCLHQDKSTSLLRALNAYSLSDQRPNLFLKIKENKKVRFPENSLRWVAQLQGVSKLRKPLVSPSAMYVTTLWTQTA